MGELAYGGQARIGGGEDRGKSGRRTWYELRITEESSLSSAMLTRELNV